MDTLEFSILYENDDFFVIDKQEGVAVVPERSPESRSMVKELSSGRSSPVFVVHRLDKEVSGAVVFAKNASSHRMLCMQFERRQVKKTYIALCLGVVVPDRGVIDSPLRQFGSGRIGVDLKMGKQSITEYEVSRRFSRFTQLFVFPRTGRRHQIRAHLYSIGHPIVGDRRYGNIAEQKIWPRMMLHAHRLEFTAPDGKRTVVESPLPESFAAVLDVCI